MLDLSVILPCYKGRELALRSVAQLEGFLQAYDLAFEIIVVDDGGGDFPDNPWESQEHVRLVKIERNQGKGAAIRAGMKEAQGDVCIFTDTDLPYDLDLLLSIHELVAARGAHLVIGDRGLSSSEYAMKIGLLRRIASAIFTEFVGRLVTGGGFFDTQCGLKGFRKDIAQELFRLNTIDRFAFDVEIIYISLIYRLDIKRIPVKLRNNETSTVNVVRDSLRMAVDVLSIKWHRMKGHYRSPFLSKITASDFESFHKQSVERHLRQAAS